MQSDVHQVIPGVALPGILLSETGAGAGADHTPRIIGAGADHIHHITVAVAATLTLHMAVVDPTRDLCPVPHPTLLTTPGTVLLMMATTIGGAVTALLMIEIIITEEANDIVQSPGVSHHPGIEGTGEVTHPVYLQGAAEEATREVSPRHQRT